MLVCCLIPLTALGLIAIFHIPLSRMIGYGMLLVCPISHLLMMRFMGHGENHQPEHPHAHEPTSISPDAHEGLEIQ